MRPTFALVGNPNVGKTALFNALTGLTQTTGNYPGVTVERKEGYFVHRGQAVSVLDLPGCYSLAARSPDEMIVADVLMDLQPGAPPIFGIIAVVDASNLERNLYFVSQIIELNKPMVLALNMMDIAQRRGIRIDTEKLEEKLGIPVVPVCAHKKQGVDELKEQIVALIENPRKPRVSRVIPDEQYEAAKKLACELAAASAQLKRDIPPQEVFRILVDEEGYAERRIIRTLGKSFRQTLHQYRQLAQKNGVPLATQEAKSRYYWVRSLLEDAVERPAQRSLTWTDRLDAVLTHRLFGTLVFLGVILFVFQLLYSWSSPFMDAIDAACGYGAWLVRRTLGGSMLGSLVADGVIGGVGSVLVFIPQIAFLSLFIAFLQDCGYMARAAFLMDKLLSWCGLSGQAFIPMLTSFACAIPGIMATRTIDHRRDRLMTILIAPLMSCSARLPVYVLMIAGFIPARAFLGGWLNLQGLVLFSMYVLGVVTAVCVAFVLKSTIFRGEKTPFLLEMPSYKVPQLRTVLLKVYFEVKEFVVRAGTLILAVSIVIWAAAYFPHAKEITEHYAKERAKVESADLPQSQKQEQIHALEIAEQGEYLRQSFLGRLGHMLEPIFVPLGWDWRIGTAALASFPAREVVIATLGTLFNMEVSADEEPAGLVQTLQEAKRTDGTPLFTPPVALSLMVFFALCCQCVATLSIIYRETHQWRWPIFTFTYMTALAYLAGTAVYQVGHRLGL
jgi:ferrous iron transport protein B